MIDYSAIYTVLVEECGASEAERTSFVRYVEEHESVEWRFSGNLGFGGKFHRSALINTARVSCYSEDRTPARAEIIKRANERLDTIVSTFILSPGAFDAFTAMLDEPAKDLPKLRELLSRPSIFEGDES